MGGAPIDLRFGDVTGYSDHVVGWCYLMGLMGDERVGCDEQQYSMYVYVHVWDDCTRRIDHLQIDNLDHL